MDLKVVIVGGILFLLLASDYSNKMFAEKVGASRPVLIILKTILFIIAFWIILTLIELVSK